MATTKTQKKLQKESVSKTKKTIKKTATKTTAKPKRPSTKAKKVTVKTKPVKEKISVKKATKKVTTKKPKAKKAVALADMEPKLVEEVKPGINPINFLLRLDVLIALSLFFLLITNIISISAIQRDVNQNSADIDAIEAFLR